jgi:hypothetical protein
LADLQIVDFPHLRTAFDKNGAGSRCQIKVETAEGLKAARTNVEDAKIHFSTSQQGPRFVWLDTQKLNEELTPSRMCRKMETWIQAIESLMEGAVELDKVVRNLPNTSVGIKGIGQMGHVGEAIVRWVWSTHTRRRCDQITVDEGPVFAAAA